MTSLIFTFSTFSLLQILLELYQVALNLNSFFFSIINIEIETNFFCIALSFNLLSFIFFVCPTWWDGVKMTYFENTRDIQTKAIKPRTGWRITSEVSNDRDFATYLPYNFTNINQRIRDFTYQRNSLSTKIKLCNISGKYITAESIDLPGNMKVIKKEIEVPFNLRSTGVWVNIFYNRNVPDAEQRISDLRLIRKFVHFREDPQRDSELSDSSIEL